ncbi:hypothetical protein NUSPORA_00202 [Nucleospora cyclopteri]
MDFLTNCKKMQNDLKHLEMYVIELDKNMKIKQNSILSQEEESNLDLRIDSTITTFTHLSEELKGNIDKSREETELMKKRNGNNHLIDLRENHTLGISKKLSDVMKKFQNVQCDFRRREKDKLKETFLIACPDATEEQLNNLDDPDKAEEALNLAFSLGSKSSRGILNEARSRKDKIDNIVEKINKLVQLIDEIDKIVNSNTAITDRLVLNMQESVQHTERAVTELRSAREYQDRRNWLTRIFTFAFFLFVLIIILLIYNIFFKPLITS